MARYVCAGMAVVLLIMPATVLADPPAQQPQGEELAKLRLEVQALREELQELQSTVTDLEDSSRQQSPFAPDTLAAPPGTTSAKTPEQLELERKLAQELGLGSDQTPESTEAPPPAPGPSKTVGGGSGRNFLNLSFDGLFCGGTSTTTDVSSIETGGHDPSQRGFTVQNAEMVLEGAVDPYFRAQGNLVFQLDDDGATVSELEEAYLVSSSLPRNLQLKAGTYFSEFGRLNSQHPHTWDFADQPLVNGRFLGPDGLRGPGARLSWLAPLGFYSEFFLSVQNGQGEIAQSFRNVPGETMFGRPIQERPIHDPGDLLYVPRCTASLDLSDTQTLVLGVSAALGPNGTGPQARTSMYGADLYWKWKSLNAQAGFPFLKLQLEAMKRSYEAASFSEDTDGDGAIDVALPAETLEDWGGYSQVLWGFRRGWMAGLRGDYLRGVDGAASEDPMTTQRWRISPSLTWYPTEFSKFRLQYNHDDLEDSRSEESIWMQFEFLIGTHGAHKF